MAKMKQVPVSVLDNLLNDAFRKVDFYAKITANSSKRADLLYISVQTGVRAALLRLAFDLKEQGYDLKATTVKPDLLKNYTPGTVLVLADDEGLTGRADS